MASLTHTTVESGREILAQLYLKDYDQPFFTCHIRLLTPQEGSIETNSLAIDLKRKYNCGSDYEAFNGDRTYRTVGKFSGDSREFGVDVIIHNREAFTTGATLALENTSLEIFSDIRRSLHSQENER